MTITSTTDVESPKSVRLRPKLQSPKRVAAKGGRSVFLPRSAAPYARAAEAAKARYPFLRSSPAPAPRAMPAQAMWDKTRTVSIPAAGMELRRFVVLAGALSISLFSTGLTADVLKRNGLSPAECLLLALSFLLSMWIAFGFMTACVGFVAMLGDLWKKPAPAVHRSAPAGRTAILMPVYNEDPAQILSAVQAMAEELAAAGHRDSYDLHILSDTRDDKIAEAEAVGFLRLRQRLAGGCRVFYRRRVKNTDKKAGNVAEWVTTQGGAYAYMLILDADSLMTADTVVALTEQMDANPRMGLLQTVPGIINAATPFARVQQFANRLYGGVFSIGQAWWSGGEGNYWGHNAMVRVAAFADSAGLPHLPGKQPFGGHILSHDFVEAALLRRAGWEVRMAAELQGSYEETPPTLLDMAARDRRWCQGNLQHARLFGAHGLHWVSRMHLIRGALAYVAPMLWLVFLAGGAMVWPEQVLTGATARHEVVELFEITVALLAGPKLMAFVVALLDPRQRKGFGGVLRLSAGLVVESVISTLTAPVTMVMQTVAVIEVLLGRDSGWSAQRREGSEITTREAWRAHRIHVGLGLAGAVIALFVDRYFLIWTSPVFLGLTLSALLSLRSSRSSTRQAGRGSLLQTPEERTPPALVVRAMELRHLYASEAKFRRQVDVLFRAHVPAYGAAATEVRRETAIRLAA